MRRAVAAAAIVAVGAMVGVVLSVGPTAASPFGGGGTTVEVTGEVLTYPPDGGMRITLAGERVEASVSTEPGTFLAVAGSETGTRLQVDVPGTVTLAGTPNVAVTNVPTVALQNGTIVNFTPETLAALTGESRVCTDYPVGNNTIGGSVFTFPAVAGQQTAALKFHDFGAAVDYVACWRSSQADGGPPPSCTPDAGVANIPLHSGDSWIVDGLADHHRLRCLTCTHAGPPSGGTALAGGSISICTPSP